MIFLVASDGSLADVGVRAWDVSTCVWFVLKQPQEEASDPKGFANPSDLGGKEKGLGREETLVDRRFYLATLRL